MIANEHITVSKTNVLPEGQDYYLLRKEGIQLIEKLGSKLWTDYNIHDPGITILEALCYAITDLSYRSNFEVKDLLAEEKPKLFNADDQAYFTAREILTTAPWTINDYRKLLIDLDGVKNAWVNCLACNCGPDLYVNCKDSELTYTKPLPPEKPEEHRVILKGLYGVNIEFDTDEKSGDLNTGKVSSIRNILVAGNPETLFFEVRFPSLVQLQKLEKTNLLFSFFRNSKTEVKHVLAKNFKDKNKIAITSDAQLKSALRKSIYVSFDITFNEYLTSPGFATSHKVTLTNVPVRLIWLKDEVRGSLVINDIKEVLEDISLAGIVSPYLNKITKGDAILKQVLQCLQAHRNITEDFCRVDEVEIEEMGVCADVELDPNADIEQVLAQAYYLIAEYFNPSIRFNTLEEMLETKTVDEVFDGPKLLHGFINESDLERTVLNRTLYSSDIINLLMDIPGVVAIKNFVLVRYDEAGDIKETDPWKLDLSPNKLPRFYLEGSKILVFKNGLPFLPDVYELMDTMQVIYGKHSMPKLKDCELDLPVPEGRHYDLADYLAVQNTLPLVYGTGEEGLPSSASDARRGQAKQLKAYLLFFEQLLVNYLGQLSNMKQLFSISTTVKQSYFPVLLNNDDISEVSDLYEALDEISLYGITESADKFLDRRNRFLDQLLARFCENFSDYALLLYSYKDQSFVEGEQLIKTKTAFLKQFPYQSAYKAQSFDYSIKPDIAIRKDISGIHQRISTLLGLKPSLNYFDYNIVKENDSFSTTLNLIDDKGQVLLSLKNTLSPTGKFESDDRDELIHDINFNCDQLLKLVFDISNYHVQAVGPKFRVDLGTPVLASSEVTYSSNADALLAINAILLFAMNNLKDEKFLIVEHILLRPHATNDALLDICVEPDCVFCGNEDPYSYQLSFVFDGESELPKKHFEFRRFAEKTIRTELPAHVLCKICWVKSSVYQSFEKAYVDWLTDTYVIPAADEECKNKVGVNNNPLKNLICEFKKLKSIYPPATLHDCVDGNDENRVFLNQTSL